MSTISNALKKGIFRLQIEIIWNVCKILDEMKLNSYNSCTQQIVWENVRPKYEPLSMLHTLLPWAIKNKRIANSFIFIVCTYFYWVSVKNAAHLTTVRTVTHNEKSKYLLSLKCSTVSVWNERSALCMHTVAFELVVTISITNRAANEL